MTVKVMPGAGPQLATHCFSTLGCPDLELEQALELAQRRGMPAVELRTLAGSNDLPQYFEARYGTPERLADAVAAFPVQVASLNSSCRAMDTTPENRVELRALVPWAAALGTSAIRVFDGGERGEDSELRAMEPLFTWWAELDVAPELIVETHDALADPRSLKRFLELYPSIGVLWDTHHTWRQGGEAPAVTWPRLRGRTRHLHVKDSAAEGGYVVPGVGEFPFAELIGALQADSFNGVVSLEWERHWYPDLPALDLALDGFDRVFSPPTGGGTA